MSTPFKMKGFSGFGNSPLHQDEKITAKDKVTPASTKINVPGLTSITVADAKAEAAVAESDDLKSAQEKILSQGDNFHVYRGLRHQIIALEDTELFEFSTQHFDEDSHRIQKGD